MLTDIDKETVDFRPNYDDRLQEPVVLPTKVPNLLLNYALKSVEPTVTSIYTYLQPVLAIAVSVAMGLDRLHFDTLVFAAVIFTGVGLVLRSYAGKSRAAEGPDAGPH